MAAYDLKDKVFDKLKVDYLEKIDSSRHNIWHCTCKCGNALLVRASDLMNGKVTMCKECKKKLHSSSNMDTSKIITSRPQILNDDVDDVEYDNITDFSEDGMDLLLVPVIFKIVHTINADLTYAENNNKGENTLAKNIDKFFRIREALDDLASIEWEVGEVINTNVVYHLLTKKDRYDKVTYETIEKCIIELKDLASHNGDFYLAFPKISCGQDKMEWDVVKKIIKKHFGNTEFQIILV